MHANIIIVTVVLLFSRRLAASMLKVKLGRREKLAAVVLVLAAIGLLGLAIVLVTRALLEPTASTSPHQSPSLCPCPCSSSSLPTVSTTTSTPTPSTARLGHDSTYKRYRFAAVTTDTNVCSQIGVLEHSLFSD